MTPLRPPSRRRFLAAASLGVGACLVWPASRALAVLKDDAKQDEGIVQTMRNGEDKVKIKVRGLTVSSTLGR